MSPSLSSATETAWHDSAPFTGQTTAWHDSAPFKGQTTVWHDSAPFTEEPWQPLWLYPPNSLARGQSEHSGPLQLSVLHGGLEFGRVSERVWHT